MDPYKNSIVHEYRVLYSTRIVQKDKKWCDGILRYYEVNNKVELSNPTQLLLVSDFLNGSVSFVMNELLASGHEFKLPNKSFLVMVDEKVGSSVRDVSQAIRARNDTVVVPQPFIKSEPLVKNEPSMEKLVASSRLVTDNKPIRPLKSRKAATIELPIIYYYFVRSASRATMMGTAFEVKIFTTGNEEANPLIAPSAGSLVNLAIKACAGNSVLEDM